MPSPVHPLLLLLVCALALSGFDLLRKLLARHLSPLLIVFTLALAAVPFFGLGALIEDSSIRPGYGLPAVASIVLNLIAHVAFVQAIRIAHLSTTVPLLSLTPVFTTLVGLVVLDEHPSLLGWLGIVLVVAGALLLHRRPPKGVAQPRTEDAAPQPDGKARLQGALLMTLTALCWSWTLPLDKLAVAHSGPALHGLVLCTGISLGALGLLAASEGLSAVTNLRRIPGLFLLTLAVSTLALALQLVVVQTLMVSLVETVKRGVGNLMAVLLGRWFLGESLDRGKIVASGTMAIGVALILS